MHCILCNSKMRGRSIPLWVFDRERREVIGVAHTSCAQRANQRYGCFGNLPLQDIEPLPPSSEVVSRLFNLIDKDYGPMEFKCALLAWRLLDAVPPTLNECLNHPEVINLLDWWQKGLMKMSAEEALKVKEVFESAFETQCPREERS